MVIMLHGSAAAGMTLFRGTYFNVPISECRFLLGHRGGKCFPGLWYSIPLTQVVLYREC